MNVSEFFRALSEMFSLFHGAFPYFNAFETLERNSESEENCTLSPSHSEASFDS